jgi:hypothetical protein
MRWRLCSEEAAAAKKEGLAMTIDVNTSPASVSSRSWSDPASNKIGTAGIIVRNYSNCHHYTLWLSFNAPRGYGDSSFELNIQPESFEHLALAMIRTDRDTAIKAFGAALQAEPKPIAEGQRWSPLWAE